MEQTTKAPLPENVGKWPSFWRTRYDTHCRNASLEKLPIAERRATAEEWARSEYAVAP